MSYIYTFLITLFTFIIASHLAHIIPGFGFLCLFISVILVRLFFGHKPTLFMLVLVGAIRTVMVIYNPSLMAAGFIRYHLGYIIYALFNFYFSWLLLQIEIKNEKIKENDDYQKVIANAASDVIISIDSDNIIQSINKSCHKMFGYEPEELLGKSVTILIPERFRLKHINGMALYLKTHKKRINWLNVETFGLTKEGKEIDIEISFGDLIFNKKVIFVAVIRDITERKQLVSEITKKTQALLQLDKQKNDFIAMLAHELRNPLSPILNSIFILKTLYEEDKNAANIFDIIQRNIDSLSSMINDLTDVTKIIRGNIGVTLEKVDLVDFCKKSVSEFKTSLGEATKNISYYSFNSPIYIRADTYRLQQILMNLLQTCIKYSKKDNHIHVFVTNENNCASIKIENSNLNFTDEVIPLLFDDVFTEVNTNINYGYKSNLYLGLSLVKQLVKIHGGEIMTEKIDDKIIFCASFPLEKENDVIFTENITFNPIKHDKKILIIDDNKDTCESLESVLDLLGYEASYKLDGLEGFKYIEIFKPDIILCDIGMPSSLDGYGVATAIKSVPEYKNIKLICLSGYGEKADIERAKLVGYDEIIVKPITPVNLQRLLNSFLGLENDKKG